MDRYVTIFPIDLATIISALALIASVAAVVSALRIHWDERRADVMAYLEFDAATSSVSLVVENLGRSVARDIHICGFDFDRLCTEPFREPARRSFIARGIPNLVPGASRRTVVASTAGHAADALLDSCEKVEVVYLQKTLLGCWKGASAEFTLDFYSFAGTVRAGHSE